ncbi:hypothetical protein ACLGI4_27460 [Streptomyces sp. HMX112]
MPLLRAPGTGVVIAQPVPEPPPGPYRVLVTSAEPPGAAYGPPPVLDPP